MASSPVALCPHKPKCMSLECYSQDYRLSPQRNFRRITPHPLFPIKFWQPKPSNSRLYRVKCSTKTANGAIVPAVIETEISDVAAGIIAEEDKEAYIDKLEEAEEAGVGKPLSSDGGGGGGGEEDGRELREIWREIQGGKNWDGFLDPMNSHLRKEILRYGEFAQACYDSFDFDPHSPYCGSCKYPGSQFFDKMDMAHYGYRMCRYLYATSNINLPNFFQKSSIAGIWSQHANWMGYVAIANDEEEIKRLGRRDIVIAWRGTVTYLEWIHDLQNMLRPAHFRQDPHIQVESGFYDLYTTREEGHCNYCSFSARQQVLAEVKRLIERYNKGTEELSITVTGHSLGGALALMTAYDIAEMRLNLARGHDDDDGSTTKTSGGAGAINYVPITVFSFASPRVGNLKFKERCEELGVKVLRIVNVHDKVPTVPGLIANEKNQFQRYLEDTVHFPWSYAHVGVELALDHSRSPFLRSTNDLRCAHNLEAHLHLVDGYHGNNTTDHSTFKLATDRDIALVNKDSNFLKPEYGVPPFWRQDHNKGMVRNSDGRWIIPERSRFEPHPPDTAHHFSLVLKMANEFLHDHGDHHDGQEYHHHVHNHHHHVHEDNDHQHVHDDNDNHHHHYHICHDKDQDHVSN